MPRYFLLTIAYFWVPVLVAGFFLRRKLDPATKKAFWWSLVLISPLCFIMEYVYLWADIWTFSQSKDPFLGIWLWGAPIEEFSFWFGAAPFFILTYLVFDRWFKKN